jgi:hypothetical protein
VDGCRAPAQDDVGFAGEAPVSWAFEQEDVDDGLDRLLFGWFEGEKER